MSLISFRKSIGTKDFFEVAPQDCLSLKKKKKEKEERKNLLLFDMWRPCWGLNVWIFLWLAHAKSVVIESESVIAVKVWFMHICPPTNCYWSTKPCVVGAL